MGEAEIQSAVEAAAVIFKKVVLQRRQAAKKANEEGKPFPTLFSLNKSLEKYCVKMNLFKLKNKKKMRMRHYVHFIFQENCIEIGLAADLIY